MDKLGGFHTYLNAQAEEYMISNTDIRYFFDTYYDNFMQSRLGGSPSGACQP